MISRLLGLRREDRRDASVGFIVLLLVMAAHAVLETARDALFLATLPPTQLPWAYLAMAALALVVVRINGSAVTRWRRARVLSSTLLLGSLGTASFWFFSSLRGSGGTLVAFYVWTGLLATILTIQVWLQLSDVLDIGQARRVYAWIGAGGLIGAALGSGVASLLLLALDARALPLAAAGMYLVASFLPFSFSKKRRPVPARSSAREEAHEAAPKKPYLVRLVLLVLTSTVVVTVVDYLFKSIVHARVPSASLGSFFAGYYGILNLLALVVQVVVAPRLIRTAGVSRALLLMPVLVSLTLLGFVFSGGIVAALLLRGSDGVLRHSVNRTGTEILFVPLPGNIRDRFKSFAEAFGQRGGQALASLLILAAIGVELSTVAIGWTLLGLSALWIVCILGIESYYLDLFRSHLQRGAIDTEGEVPELDLRTLETLLASLSSEDDAEVVAALDMFAVYERAQLVPALVLFHPSRPVVLRSFELFSDSARTDVVGVSGRLLGHPDREIRAAALRLWASRQPSRELLERRMSDPSPAVRATALVGLTAGKFIAPDTAKRELERIVESGPDEARDAVALSLRLLPGDRFLWLAEALAALTQPGLAAAVARSIASSPEPAYVQLLIRLLAQREARADARLALLRLGPVALDALGTALNDASLPRTIRRHVPRTISKFAGPRAAAILVTALSAVEDDAVVFKILRGLGRMRGDHPELRIDAEPLEQLADASLRRAATLLFWRVVVQSAQGGRASRSSELLMTLLSDQEEHALERLFRALHILDPKERFAMIHEGLKSRDPQIRAASAELLRHVAPAGLASALTMLVDRVSPRERLQAIAPHFDPPDRARWEELILLSEAGDESAEVTRELAELENRCLAAMLEDRSEVLRSIARYHVEVELRMGSERASAARRMVASGQLNHG